MVKPSKLYAQLLTSRTSMRFRDFERILKAFGFSHEGTKGSHHKYDHPLAARPLSIQPKGNMAKPYQIDQFLDIVEEFGLKIEE
jgi:predicted RNA binding protein YcfA (HicA-like mRNA interferase family)